MRTGRQLASDGIPEEAIFYPEVTVYFGKPYQQVLRAAIDMSTWKPVIVEYYIYRELTPPTPIKQYNLPRKSSSQD